MSITIKKPSNVNLKIHPGFFEKLFNFIIINELQTKVMRCHFPLIIFPQIKKYISSVFLLLRVYLSIFPGILIGVVFLQDGLALLKSVSGLEVYPEEIIP